MLSLLGLGLFNSDRETGLGHAAHVGLCKMILNELTGTLGSYLGFSLLSSVGTVPLIRDFFLPVLVLCDFRDSVLDHS